MEYSIFRRSRDSVARQVCRDFPRMRNLPVSEIYQGWDHAVIIFDKRFVFRFPKSAADARQMRHEIAFMARYAKSFGVPVPHYTFLPSSGAYAGYHAIKGAEFWPWRYKKLTPLQKEKVAKTLAHFLRQLHRIPVSVAARYGMRNQLRSDFWSITKRYRRFVIGKLSRQQKARVEDFIAQYRNTFLSKPLPLAIVHSDMTPDHIFLDPRAGKISGVIDFSDMQVDVPSRDFHRFHIYGKKFMERLLYHYCKNDPIFTQHVILQQELLTLDRMADALSGEPMDLPAEWQNFRKIFHL